MSLLFNMLSSLEAFSSKEQACFNFMAAVTICSDSGAPQNKVSHCFHCFPIYLPWSDRTGCHDLSLKETNKMVSKSLCLFWVNISWENWIKCKLPWLWGESLMTSHTTANFPRHEKLLSFPRAMGYRNGSIQKKKVKLSGKDIWIDQIQF